MPTRSRHSSITSKLTARTWPPPATAAVPLFAASSSISYAMIWPARCNIHACFAIPSKKAPQRPATYLEVHDVRAIITKPDRRTNDGWRDYTLLLFLYNCGARVAEVLAVEWADLQLVPPRQVRLRGKGRKERLVPLWRETADALHRLRGMVTSAARHHVFVNHHGQPLTRDGVAYILHKYASALAAQERPGLAQKRITPHVLRHYISFRTMSRTFGFSPGFLANFVPA